MKFLILACKYGRACELEYASCVAKDYIAPILRSLGHEVIIVEQPSPEDANNAIKQHDPDIIWFVGHGNVGVTSLERVQIWIADKTHCSDWRGDKNLDIFNGKIVNALSCLTGACLGKSLTKYHGCKYYLGYKKEFWFIVAENPPSCDYACAKKDVPEDWQVRQKVLEYALICMHECNLYFLIGLARGFTPEQAHGYSLKRFDQWLSFWNSFEGESNVEETLAALTYRVLLRDKPIQVLCHNGEYVEPDTPPEDPPEIPPIDKAIVYVLSVPSGANVYINGELKGKTPLKVLLKKGEYTIRCELEGYNPLERTITVEEGRTYYITFRLEKTRRINYMAMMSAPLILVAMGLLLQRMSRYNA